MKYKIVFNSFLLIASSCVLFSCKSANSDVIYKRCVVEKTQKTLVEGYGVKKDIFKLLEEAEILLIENELIQNRSKESFLKLTEIVFNDKEISKQIARKIRTNVNENFFDFLFLTSLHFYSTCPDEVYKNEIDDVKRNILIKRFKLYSSLMTDGFKSQQSITSLINEFETFSKTERLVILHLILMNVFS
ncbi:MAG: hypothetical protein ACK4UK_01900 [Flavobacterium sp.]